MSQGLKEHSVFFLFRQARYDIGQNVGLFLVCLLDRWVSIVMSGSGNANVFSNFTVATEHLLSWNSLIECGTNTETQVLRLIAR